MKNRWIRILFGITFSFACAMLPLKAIEVQPEETLPSESASPPAIFTATSPVAPSELPTQALLPPAQSTGALIDPHDLEYLGAFRLPEGRERPFTFEYGGSAMTFRPDGDSSGEQDGFPGSLFITGHDRMAYGELLDGSQVAEVSIPAPRRSKDLSALNRAIFLQDFQDVARGFFANLDEIPRIGMQFLDTPETGPKIHLAWGQHLQEADEPSHAWFDPDLSEARLQGEWHIGNQPVYAVNGYLFEIPDEWAEQLGGRRLATGRFRDGGWAGMGPALFAYRPWQVDGSPPAPGTRLEEIVLLRYASSRDTDHIESCLQGYQHPDEWEGGAWLMHGERSAVLFAGTKSVGEKYWYGYANPLGTHLPCVDEAMVGLFTVCRLADGAPCPEQDLHECAGHNDYRGWWSTRFQAQLIFYNPNDLVNFSLTEAQGEYPQPYAVLDIDEVLLFNPDDVELDLIGRGDQRRFRIGEAAFDRTHGLLYILELFADGAQPVVHVWRLR